MTKMAPLYTQFFLLEEQHIALSANDIDAYDQLCSFYTVRSLCK